MNILQLLVVGHLVYLSTLPVKSNFLADMIMRNVLLCYTSLLLPYLMHIDEIEFDLDSNIKSFQQKIMHHPLPGVLLSVMTEIRSYLYTFTSPKICFM